MSESPQSRNESQFVNMTYGTYSDVLFVLFPFLVIGLQGLWRGELAEVLLRPDLSIAAAILAGLAIGRFVLGLIANHELGRYKERIVFFIAATLFTVLGPSLLLILLIVGDDRVPEFVSFVQPILLIIAISLYTTAVSISNILSGSQYEQRQDDRHARTEDDKLALPRRGEGAGQNEAAESAGSNSRGY